MNLRISKLCKKLLWDDESLVEKSMDELVRSLTAATNRFNNCQIIEEVVRR